MDPKVEINPTHVLEGWFNGALEGQEDGDLYRFGAPTPAEKQADGTYIVILHCTEYGTNQPIYEKLTVEPLTDPEFPSTIIPYLPVQKRVVAIGRKAPGVDLLIAEEDFAHGRIINQPEGTGE